MPSLWFVVPAHGRFDLATVCLRQLRRTCDALLDAGIEASAVVVGDDPSLQTATELGFGTVRRDNRFLSRKFNDGIQLALDERFNPRPADYVVPFGSDDWVDWRLFTDLPDRHDGRVPQPGVRREDGLELRGSASTIPAARDPHLAAASAREGRVPARRRALRRGCDTSMLINVDRALNPLRVEHRDERPAADRRLEDAGAEPEPVRDGRDPVARPVAR